MSNNIVEQADTPPVNDSAKPPHHNKIGQILLWIIILFMLVSGVIAGYFTYMKLNHIQNKLRELPNISQRQETIAEQSQQFTNKIKQLEQNQSITIAELKRIQAINQSNHDDWFLLQAKDYLTMAGIDLYLTDSVKPVLTLFTEADRVLTQVNNSQILPVRQSIAKEKAMIIALPEIDFVGVISQLQALENKAKTLPLKSPLMKNKQEFEKSQLEDTMSLLKKLVIIRRTDLKLEQVWSPSQEMFIRERIQFYLEISEWALLHKEEGVYQTALQQVTEVIKQFFDVEAIETKAFLQQVANLQELHLKVEKPAIGESLRLLNRILDKDHQSGESSI